jgi:hypothetical protein
MDGIRHVARFSLLSGLSALFGGAALAAALLGLGPGRLAAQTLQLPVTELRILGADGADTSGGSRQSGPPAEQARGITTASARLTLPAGSVPFVVTDGPSSIEPRQQATDPAGATRIRLTLSEPVPAPPRRLTPPPARPEIATTWVAAGQVRLDAPPAAPPVEGGSVRLTFHAAVPGTRSASAGRFHEDLRPATPDRPARYQGQSAAARPGAGWPLNPLRAGGSWQGR